MDIEAEQTPRFLRHGVEKDSPDLNARTVIQASSNLKRWTLPPSGFRSFCGRRFAYVFSRTSHRPSAGTRTSKLRSRLSVAHRLAAKLDGSGSFVKGVLQGLPAEQCAAFCCLGAIVSGFCVTSSGARVLH
jgi:hypothetical protein